jgi:hypothetical protein
MDPWANTHNPLLLLQLILILVLVLILILGVIATVAILHRCLGIIVATFANNTFVAFRALFPLFSDDAGATLAVLVVTIALFGLR